MNCPPSGAIDTLAPLGGQFIYTSGVWALGNTTHADETSPQDPLRISAWRVEHENLVLQSPSRTVIRPGCVYGGKQSLLAGWFAAVEQNQPVEIVGDGQNRWAMIDIHDLAALYVAAVEQRAPGLLHAVDDEDAQTVETDAGTLLQVLGDQADGVFEDAVGSLVGHLMLLGQ